MKIPAHRTKRGVCSNANHYLNRGMPQETLTQVSEFEKKASRRGKVRLRWGAHRRGGAHCQSVQLLFWLCC
jgi:hypothetical protein